MTFFIQREAVVAKYVEEDTIKEGAIGLRCGERCCGTLARQ